MLTPAGIARALLPALRSTARNFGTRDVAVATLGQEYTALRRAELARVE